jgi:hypothetical protein
MILEYFLANNKKPGFSFRKFGFVLGMFVVIISVLWATVTCLFDSESTEDITWVG